MRFAKLHALGNDFVVVERGEAGEEADLGRLAATISERHFGAGADGVVFVDRGSDDADWTSRIFNADGSEAEVSGNGTRCLAAYLDAIGKWPARASEVRIGTAAGVKLVRRVPGEGATPRYEMAMGAPRFASADVPMSLDPPRERVVGYPLDVEGARYDVTALSIGNPHCSLFVADLDAIDFRRIGASIERHPLFPERVNVEFVRVEAPERLRVLFWERGVGETLSSGTGASAAAVAAIANGLAARRVVVETPAGALEVAWRAEDGLVTLTGPAELVYTATWARR
jgi:diaminopimelate epimerase